MKTRIVAIPMALLLGVALTLGMVELASRAHLLPCVPNAPNVWEPHPQFGWFHRAGTSGWGQGCVQERIDWRSHVEINDQGLRDDEPHPYEKPDGVFRVLLVGDSFTEGFTVDLDEHFAPDLERQLSARAGAPVEVLNSGVSAWGNAQQLIYFLVEGVRYSPDLVVLLFNPGNDVGENVPGLGRHEPKLAAKPWFVLEGGQLKVRDFPVRRRAAMPGSENPIEDLLERRTHAYPILRSLTRKVRESGGWAFDAVDPAPNERGPHRPARAAAAPAARARARTFAARTEARGARPPRFASTVREPSAQFAFALETLTPRWADAWRLTRELLLEMRRRVEATGARFVVAIVPSKTAVRGRARSWHDGRQRLSIDPARPETRSAEFFLEEGFATCPLLPAFLAHFAATGRDGFHGWDIHWNPDGHAIVAEELASCIERLGAAPARGDEASRRPHDAP